MNNIESARRILFEAINDYPKGNLSTSKELLFELYKNISFPITFVKLKVYLDKIDLSHNAWEAESLSSLLQLFGSPESETLEEIINIIDPQ